MEVKKDILKNEIVRPTIMKRVGVAIIDLFFFLLLFLVFNSYIISPLFAKSGNYLQLVESYTQRMLDSHLYIKTDEGIIEVMDSLTEEDNQREFYQNIDEHLINFYTDFANEGINIDTYNQSKEESTYFELINNEYVIKSDVEVTKLETFFNTEYDKALTLFNNYDDVYLDLARDITTYSIFTIIVSITLASLILYLIIPLVMKNGETLGKKIFSIGLASAKDGFRVKKSQIVVRYLIFYFIEIIVSIIAVGLPLLISFTMLVFNKNGYTIHDYLAATVLVDRKKSIIYKDYEEFANHERIALN